MLFCVVLSEVGYIWNVNKRTKRGGLKWSNWCRDVEQMVRYLWICSGQRSACEISRRSETRKNRMFRCEGKVNKIANFRVNFLVGQQALLVRAWANKHSRGNTPLHGLYSEIGMCGPKEYDFFQPFRLEIGYRYWPFWSLIGYGFYTIVLIGSYF